MRAEKRFPFSFLTLKNIANVFHINLQHQNEIEYLFEIFISKIKIKHCQYPMMCENVRCKNKKSTNSISMINLPPNIHRMCEEQENSRCYYGSM